MQFLHAIGQFAQNVNKNGYQSAILNLVVLKFCMGYPWLLTHILFDSTNDTAFWQRLHSTGQIEKKIKKNGRRSANLNLIVLQLAWVILGHWLTFDAVVMVQLSCTVCILLGKLYTKFTKMAAGRPFWIWLFCNLAWVILGHWLTFYAVVMVQLSCTVCILLGKLHKKSTKIAAGQPFWIWLF